MGNLATTNLSRAPLPDYAKPDDIALTRNRILDAAAHLFSTRGFRGTTTRAISEIVGILSGSLFHYFKSKDQMLFEVMHQAAESLCVRAAAVVAAAPDPRAKLRAIIRLQLDCIVGEESRDFYAALISEWREVDAADKPTLTRLRKRYFDVWHAVLEECERQGMLRAEAKATQFMLHGAINWAATWFKPQGRLSMEDYADLLEQLVLNGDRCTIDTPMHPTHLPRKGSSAVTARRKTASGRNRSAVRGPGGSRS